LPHLSSPWAASPSASHAYNGGVRSPPPSKVARLGISSRSRCGAARREVLLAPASRLPWCPAAGLAWPGVCGAWLVRCVRVAGACRGEVLPLAVWRPGW
jgi:hypothetical protein